MSESNALVLGGTGQNAVNVGVGTPTPGYPLDVVGAINSSAGFDLGGMAFAIGSAFYYNAFLGGAGNSTTTGYDNTGSGFYALYANTGGSYNTANGAFALQFNTTGSNNTALGTNALIGNQTGSGNTAVGSGALGPNQGNENSASGFNALTSNESGSYNTASGAMALQYNSTGSFNTASGYNALQSNTTGGSNTAVGVNALQFNTTGGSNTASGVDALQSNTSGTQNTASGAQALTDNTTGTNNTASGALALFQNSTGSFNTASGTYALEYNSTGSYNMASGALALVQNSTGSGNTASRYQALTDNTTGGSNTAEGNSALENNTTGNYNTASGNSALVFNSTGSFNTALGDLAGQTLDGSGNSANNNTFLGAGAALSTGSLSNATAVGSNSVVAQSNTLVLGCIPGMNQCSGSVSVGIGTTAPSNVFTIAKGAGPAISDGWTTYSSRRWKTNIQTLHGALAKVEKLRGVSYDLRDSGKHEVGVIAEEVGAVVPEVVTYEDNGKDARGVDYSRLTALLIEATKEQQRDLANALLQIKRQQSLLRAQAAAMWSLQTQVREDRETLRKVKAQVSSGQPTLLATK